MVTHTWITVKSSSYKPVITHWWDSLDDLACVESFYHQTRFRWVVGFYLKLSQIPDFQKAVVPSGQQEWFTPVPADHVDVWWVSCIGREHWIGRWADVPDTDRLIHRTRCKNLRQKSENKFLRYDLWIKYKKDKLLNASSSSRDISVLCLFLLVQCFEGVCLSKHQLGCTLKTQCTHAVR